MRVGRHLGPLLAVVLVLNLISTIAAPSVAVADERPALTYFALGDSYASGHGLQNDGGEPCRRSPHAYPYLVRDALSETYAVDFPEKNHLACSGATAGPKADVPKDRNKSISNQLETVNNVLDDRDGMDPVLVTITIGANDVGLQDPDTLLQVIGRHTSATGFFEWLDSKTSAIASALTPGIDNLMAHENVYIVLTDYPNPFPKDGFSAIPGGGTCTDIFFTLTCDEAVDWILVRLNSILVDQFLQINQPGRLRVAPLGTIFSSHHAARTVLDCKTGKFAESTWFQDDCGHPNAAGAQAIADVIVERVHVMLPAPVTPPPTQASEAGSNASDPASGVPTFHLPWEAGSVWQITVGNGQGEHSNEANYHGFDAVPAPGRGTDKVVAVADGTVMDFQESMPDSALVNSGHAGNCVIIDHGGSVYSIYAHLAQDSVPLSKGQHITSGTVIGTMGNSGFSIGPHLHWAVLNSARMYTDANVSPYQTCAGRTMESRYADNDAELIEDGGVPRTGRYYASTNVGSGTVQAPPAPTDVPPAPTQVPPTEVSPTQVPLTEAATQSTEPDGTATITPAPAQGNDLAPMDIGATGPNGHEIGAQFTVTREDGTFLGSCTLEGNGDEPYPLSCRVDVPRGTTVVVTLDVDTITPGYAPVENPMSFDTSSDPGAASHWGVFFQLEPQESSTGVEEFSDVAIETYLDGSPYYDVCYILADYSNEGCDRNDDGMVTFEDVPLGTYIVRQTADLPEGYVVQDFRIDVTGTMQGGWETFEASVEVGAGGSSIASESDAVDIALITREPENGDLLTGTCYVLVDYSNEGCDENGDGQVPFADIPFGTYTVRQTQTPAGYPTISDYEIAVEPTGYMEGPSFGVPLGFIVRQAPEQNAPDTRNVSVVFLDMVTHERVTTGACVELIGASEIGCDRDLVDGQADFLDVPAGGPYELSFSNLPAGYDVGEVGGPLAVTIDAGPNDPANVMVFVLLAASDGAGNAPIETAVSNSSSGAQYPASTSGVTEATVLMTFRGCLEGFVPDVDDPYTACTIPLDAPDASLVGEWGVGQSLVPITGLERQHDGSYIFHASSDHGYSLELTGLEPVLRDDFLIYGVDDQDGSSYVTLLDNGETREIFVFYYYI